MIDIKKVKLLYETFKYQEALDALSQMPESEEALSLMIQCYKQTSQYERALQNAELLILRNPNSAAGYLEKITCLTFMGNTEEAYSLIEEKKNEKSITNNPWFYKTKMDVICQLKSPEEITKELINFKSQFQSNNQYDYINDLLVSKFLSFFGNSAINLLKLHGLMKDESELDCFETNGTFKDNLKRFIPIGGDCEQGFFQRSQNYEPISLFRWKSIDTIKLSVALRNNFEDFNLIEDYTLTGTYEYILDNRRYPGGMHTHIHPNTITKAELLPKMVQRQAYMIEHFKNQVRTENNIFVHQFKNTRDYQFLNEQYKILSSLGLKKILFIHLGEPPSHTDVINENFLVSTVTKVYPNLQSNEWIQIINFASSHFRL
jgi:tetratricopeptide (TPR) repeat protein